MNLFFRFRLMWDQLRSFVFWLHAPEHVARFQRAFGVLPRSAMSNQHVETQKNNKHVNGVIDRHHKRKVTYDTNVIDECLQEIKHSTEQKPNPTGIDYQVTIWFWYYFFQFGSALGNEIFYIIFFPFW